MKRTSYRTVYSGIVDRRRFLGTLACSCALGTTRSALSMQLVPSLSGSLTKEQRDSMTPAQVIDELKKGNERFRSGKMAIPSLPPSTRWTAPSLRCSSVDPDFGNCLFNTVFGPRRMYAYDFDVRGRPVPVSNLGIDVQVEV